MGIFGKKQNKDENFKIQLERESLEKLNKNEDYDFTLPFEDVDNIGKIKPIGQFKNHTTNMITAEEILGHDISNSTHPNNTEIKESKIEMSPERQNRASDFLYKKMSEARTIATENSIAESKTKKDEKIINVSENPPALSENKHLEKNNSKTTSASIEQLLKELHKDAERYTKIEKVKEKTDINNTVQTEIKKADFKSKPETTIKPSAVNSEIKSAEQRRASLLARCNAYLQDEEFGTLREPNTEKYKLESVDSILKSLEERATQRAIKNHNINIANIGDNNTGLSNGEKNSNTISASTSVNDILKSFSKVQIKEEPNKSVKETTIQKKNDSTETEAVKHHSLSEKSTEKETPNTDFEKSKTRIIDNISDNLSKNSAVEDNSTQIFKTVTVKVNNMQSADQDLFSKSSNKENISADDNSIPDIEDYNSIKDKGRVMEQLKKTYFKYIKSCIFNFLMLILSVLLITPVSNFVNDYGVNVYHLLSMILLLITTAVNFEIFKSVRDLINSKPNSDLSSVFSTASVFLYTLLQSITGSDTPTMLPVAVFILFMSSVGKSSKAKRILKNFYLIADESTKQAVTVLKNKSATKTIVGNSIEGNALLCHGTKTVNITDFLKYSYCPEPNSVLIRNITFVGLITSVIMFIITAAVSAGNFVSAIFTLSCVLCITATPSIYFLTDLPLKSASSRLSCYGAMLTGYRAADQLDHCNAISTDCNSLFPNGTVRLVDMKPLSNNPVYQSIMEAIAITEYIGSPLAGMFRQAMDTPIDKPLKVDTVVYEDKMGISGWVNDKRVFVGNRVLMESHGISGIPSIELDKKIMRKGYFPIYLAVDNLPCVLFIARYIADEEITYELRRLCNTGTTVLVKNCDPNISADMLCDYFGLYKDSIAIMTKQGSDQYNLITAKKESCSSGASCSKSVCGLFATLTASIGLKKLISVTSVLYVICTVLGILSVAIVSLMGIIGLLSPIGMLVFLIASTIITLLPAIIKRP